MIPMLSLEKAQREHGAPIISLVHFFWTISFGFIFPLEPRCLLDVDSGDTGRQAAQDFVDDCACQSRVVVGSYGTMLALADE